MKYKLKEHVTDEMLIECGFIIRNQPYYRFADKNYEKDYENSLYISLSENYKAEPYREVSWNAIDKIDDITPYIKDLINLGYVEVVE